MTRLAFGVGLVAVLVGCAAAGDSSPPSGTWRGSFRLPSSADAVPISVAVTGERAVVALGAGHSARTVVPVRGGSERLRFSLPSRSGAVPSSSSAGTGGSPAPSARATSGGPPA